MGRWEEYGRKKEERIKGNCINGYIRGDCLNWKELDMVGCEEIKWRRG